MLPRPRSLPRLLLPLLVVCSLGAGLGAQVVWKLPQRGAVFYKRERTQHPAALGGNCGFDRMEMPPVLLQGELDAYQQYQDMGPADLRDLPAWCAMDLRKADAAAPVNVSIDTLRGLGTVRINGKASAVSESDGSQTLELTFRTSRAPTGPFGAGVEGTLKIRRKVDAGRGIVSSFEAELSAKFKRRRDDEDTGGMPGVGGVLQTFHIKDRWTFDRIERNREPAFRARVVETIRRGAERIKERLAGAGKPGTSQTHMMPMEVDCSAGELALCLLTLVKAEVDRKDPTLVAGFDRLRKRVMQDTYSLSVALMAMEALYAPTNERENLIAGRIKAPMPREVPAEDLALMKEWTKRLLENNDRSVKSPYLLRFHYQTSSTYDNSNTQYALLGLYSAHLCGVKIPSSVWMANAKHWLEQQAPDGKGSVQLNLTSHQDYAKMRQAEAQAAAEAKKTGKKAVRPARGGRRTVTGGIRAAGWYYIKAEASLKLQFPEPQTASMTTAGLTGVALCNAVLSGGGKKGKNKRKNPLKGRLERARDEGFAWLLRNFSVRTNRFSNIGWYYYYMYGLERVCELSQIALIGDRDWYFEGATLLVEMAKGGGHFDGADLAGDCFAILFLKLASPPMPVITRRR